MEELEALYKPIPAYSTNEYKVAGRNLHIDKTEAFEEISRRVKGVYGYFKTQEADKTLQKPT